MEINLSAVAIVGIGFICKALFEDALVKLLRNVWSMSIEKITGIKLPDVKEYKNKIKLPKKRKSKVVSRTSLSIHLEAMKIVKERKAKAAQKEYRLRSNVLPGPGNSYEEYLYNLNKDRINRMSLENIDEVRTTVYKMIRYSESGSENIVLSKEYLQKARKITTYLVDRKQYLLLDKLTMEQIDKYLESINRKREKYLDHSYIERVPSSGYRGSIHEHLQDIERDIHSMIKSTHEIDYILFFNPEDGVPFPGSCEKVSLPHIKSNYMILVPLWKKSTISLIKEEQWGDDGAGVLLSNGNRYLTDVRDPNNISTPTVYDTLTHKLIPASEIPINDLHHDGLIKMNLTKDSCMWRNPKGEVISISKQEAGRRLRRMLDTLNHQRSKNSMEIKTAIRKDVTRVETLTSLNKDLLRDINKIQNILHLLYESIHPKLKKMEFKNNYDHDYGQVIKE